MEIRTHSQRRWLFRAIFRFHINEQIAYIYIIEWWWHCYHHPSFGKCVQSMLRGSEMSVARFLTPFIIFNKWNDNHDKMNEDGSDGIKSSGCT